MQSISIALQGDEAPPELAQWLKQIVLWLGADALLVQNLRVVGAVAALLFEKLRQIAVVVVDQRVFERPLVAFKYDDFMHLPRRIIVRRADL